MPRPLSLPLARLWTAGALAALLGLAPAHAQPDTLATRVLVRAVAHDAKIIGSNVGGARILIQEAETGRVLAEGVQQGSTGDTRRIVVDPVARGDTVFATEGAAGFTATLPLTAPTWVDISAAGPLVTPGALARSAKRMLLVPGRDVLGEGVILVLNGFTVRLTPPPTAGRTLDVTAAVTLLCGCPTEPGGLWDADAIEVVARLLRDGEAVAEAPLRFTGEESTFGGPLTAPGPGAFTLQVLASDPARGNFGLAEHPVFVP